MKLERVPALRTALLALALEFAILCAGECASPAAPLRVGLLRYYSSPSEVTVSASSAFTITDPGGAALLSCAAREPVRVQAAGGGVLLTGPSSSVIESAGPVTVSAAAAGSLISLDGPRRRHCEYRGDIEITRAGAVLRLVNAVMLEDYLLGVLPGEMPAHYPAEALKAQAVAARTYALGVRKHASSGFDICDRTDCQVYGGALVEEAACSRAVTETRGIGITYNGKPASIMYCADCGGRTRPYGGNYPYLCGVVEPDDIAHCSWEVRLTLVQLSEKLRAAGVSEVNGLTGVAVEDADASGRARAIRVTTASGPKSVSAEKFRAAIGGDIKSLLFAVAVGEDGTVTLCGKGNGHGVGMCQVGARGLAQPPHSYSFDRILSHYFPGTALSSVQGPPALPPAKSPAPRPQPQSPPIDIRIREPRL